MVPLKVSKKTVGAVDWYFYKLDALIDAKRTGIRWYIWVAVYSTGTMFSITNVETVVETCARIWRCSIIP